MTRRNLLVLVAILFSVFTFSPVSPVSACELNAGDQCVQMTAPDHAAQYLLAITPASTNLFSPETGAALIVPTASIW